MNTTFATYEKKMKYTYSDGSVNRLALYNDGLKWIENDGTIDIIDDNGDIVFWFTVTSWIDD